jgi:iron only hydrogenase large subunit-like protein
MNGFRHTIVRDDSKCFGCVACCKACPSKAIRVRSGLPAVDDALCLDCGECIRACPHGAVTARTSSPSDLKRFRHTVAIPSTSLYSQFGRDVLPERVGGALLRVGFDAFYDVSWMCVMAGSAIDTYLSECRGPWPKISSTCPAVVRLVQLRYPDLVPHIVPIETPRELTAKLARRRIAAALGLADAEIGVFYITPCSAIMESIVAPVGLDESYFDGALSAAELFNPMMRALKDGCPAAPEESFDIEGLRWALAGGEAAGMRNANTLAVSGVSEVVRVLEGIGAGKFQSLDFVEAHICPDGCIGGPLLVEDRFVARGTLQRLLGPLAEQASSTSGRARREERARAMFHQHFFDIEAEIKARPIRNAARDLKEAIALRRERLRVLEGLPRKDCAACGAPDCETFAHDVVADRAVLTDCVFVKLRQSESAGGERP